MAGIGDAEGDYIVYNFPYATSLTMTGGNTIKGTVFAPQADIIKNTSGNIDGQVIGKSPVMNGGEIHYRPFGTVTSCTPVCVPPAVNLTQDGPLTCTKSGVTISATATPLAGVTYAWTVPAGAANPGNVASFTTSTAGTYQVIVSGLSAGCSTSESISVTSHIQSPEAGPDIEVACTGTQPITQATLQATPLSDAFWHQIGNRPFLATITDRSDPNTTISGLVAGTYIFAWKSGDCADTVKVTIPACDKEYDLALDKSISRKMAAQGDTVSYVLRVWNEGNATAHDIEATDRLIAGVQYIAHRSPVGTYTTNYGIWRFDSLMVGDTVVLELNVRVIA